MSNLHINKRPCMDVFSMAKTKQKWSKKTSERTCSIQLSVVALECGDVRIHEGDDDSNDHDGVLPDASKARVRRNGRLFKPLGEENPAPIQPLKTASCTR